jgi:hypothetical protein
MRQFLGRITNDGTDGALIRLSIALRNNETENARERLIALDLQVEAELDKVWPRAPRHLPDSPIPLSGL